MHIPGFETRTVEVAPGVTLRAETAGEGTPVVLLHGFPQTRHMWRHVAADLARDHRVVVPDLRGYGDSAKPVATTPDVYAKRTMGADVVALADALDVDRFVLVGHDRGALVAFRAALDHKVICVPGLFFDVNPGHRRAQRLSRFHNYVRLSFGPTLEEVTRGMDRLGEMIGRFR